MLGKRASRLRRIGDLNPGWALNPNRISSLDLGRPDQFNLDRHEAVVQVERASTEWNCNPNCNPGRSLP